MTDISSRLQRSTRLTPLSTAAQPLQTDRAHLLSSLRSSRASPSPLPTHNNSAAFALQQQQANYQSAYLQLQQQILLQQSQLILQQQQEQAEMAMRQLRRSSMQGQMGGMSLGGMGAVGGIPSGGVGVRTPLALSRQQGQQQQHQLRPEEDEESVRGNPLAASALARRKKRQSLVLESTSLASQAQGVVVPAVSHHRRSSSSTTGTSLFTQNGTTSRPSVPIRTSSSPPPALVLSKPGEAFPSTSSTTSSVSTSSEAGGRQERVRAKRYSISISSNRQGSVGGHNRTSSITSSSPSTSVRELPEDGALGSPPLFDSNKEEDTSIRPWLASVVPSSTPPPSSPPLPLPVEAIVPATPTLSPPTPTTPLAPVPPSPSRPSQASSLAAALSGRRKRPQSMGGPPSGDHFNGGMRIDTTAGLGVPPGTAGVKRSVSDTTSTLSPFATTFQPLPTTPTNYSYNNGNSQVYSSDKYEGGGGVRTSPPPRSPGGGGVPIRMPKGPEGFDENSFNGGEKNFARRVRRGALEVLRSAGQGNGGRRGV